MPLHFIDVHIIQLQIKKVWIEFPVFTLNLFPLGSTDLLFNRSLQNFPPFQVPGYQASGPSMPVPPVSVIGNFILCLVSSIMKMYFYCHPREMQSLVEEPLSLKQTCHYSGLTGIYPGDGKKIPVFGQLGQNSGELPFTRNFLAVLFIFFFFFYDSFE